MKALRFLVFGSLASGVGLLACAQGGETDFDGDGGSGTGTTTTPTTTTTDTGSTTTTSSEPCPPPEHLCGQVCAGNTPQTGCYQSTSCSPCTPVPNGTTICSADGLCDVTCIAPYEKEGSACVCPFECCTSMDCAQGATCNTQTNTCIQPCDEMMCLMMCMGTDQLDLCVGLPPVCCGPQGCPCGDIPSP